ncbi:MAG: hypothetical protein IH624_02550 [Phycisphaerae bacterium]|nr:hypothetical protein [Phycisphaerae bacterium]
MKKGGGVKGEFSGGGCRQVIVDGGGRGILANDEKKDIDSELLLRKIRKVSKTSVTKKRRRICCDQKALNR